MISLQSLLKLQAQLVSAMGEGGYTRVVQLVLFVFRGTQPPVNSGHAKQKHLHAATLAHVCSALWLQLMHVQRGMTCSVVPVH